MMRIIARRMKAATVLDDPALWDDRNDAPMEKAPIARATSVLSATRPLPFFPFSGPEIEGIKWLHCQR